MRGLLVLIPVGLILAGCAGQPASGPSVYVTAEPAPVTDTRVEETAAFLYTAETADSQSIADGLRERGIYDDIAEDLVGMCDEGADYPEAYASQFDGQFIQPYIIQAWDIACP